MPWPPWAHGGYFAPARRYGARAALARTQRGGFRSTFVGDRRSVEEESHMLRSVLCCTVVHRKEVEQEAAARTSTPRAP